MSGPRNLAQRKADTLAKLATDDDIWVASTNGPGDPCLVPLSFAWVQDRVILVTSRSNRTARNIGETSSAHLALGPTRDVVSLEGVAEVRSIGELDKIDADAYAARTGWDPRDDDSLVWIVFQPLRVQAWREVDELTGRTLMEEGRWLV